MEILSAEGLNCILCTCLVSEKISHNTWKAVDFYHCHECDIIFRDPKTWLNAESEKGRYLFHQNTLDNKGYLQQFDPLFQWISGNVFENALDFGCGPNPVLAQLMDIKKISKNSAKFYDPYFFPNGLAQGDPNLKYDLITMTEVFEHCFQPRAIVETVIEILNKEAFWYVQTNLWLDKENFADWWYAKDPTHVVFYSLKTWDWICANFQLKLIKSDGKKNFLFVKA